MAYELEGRFISVLELQFWRLYPVQRRTDEKRLAVDTRKKKIFAK